MGNTFRIRFRPSPAGCATGGLPTSANSQTLAFIYEIVEFEAFVFVDGFRRVPRNIVIRRATQLARSHWWSSHQWHTVADRAHRGTQGHTSASISLPSNTITLNLKCYPCRDTPGNSARVPDRSRSPKSHRMIHNDTFAGVFVPPVVGGSDGDSRDCGVGAKGRTGMQLSCLS